MRGDRKQLSRRGKTRGKFAARPEEIVYDAEDHREFVTGFRRRKDERRRRAENELAEQARKERIEKRKEKRQLFKKMREARGIHAADYADDDIPSEEEPRRKGNLAAGEQINKRSHKTHGVSWDCVYTIPPPGGRGGGCRSNYSVVENCIPSGNLIPHQFHSFR